MKRKMGLLLMTAALLFAGMKNFSVPVQANQVTETNKEVEQVKVSDFRLSENSLYKQYASKYQVNQIESYSNNGGHYSGSMLKYAFDGNLQTHWETGKPNNANFQNYIDVIFTQPEEINRIVYTPRSGNKGHIKNVRILVSNQTSGDNFDEVAVGSIRVSSISTEIKFTETTFQRLRFIFEEANADWAAAGEIQFFRKDDTFDKMSALFTTSAKNQVSKEFASDEKLAALSQEAAAHPLAQLWQEDLDNARILLEGEAISSSTAQMTRFQYYNQNTYNTAFQISPSQIMSIENNGGSYNSQKIAYAVDGNTDTYWETGRGNSATFKNEVYIQFKEAVAINRIVYGARKTDNKGFATKISIYGTKTSAGDNFSLIATGKISASADMIEAKFHPATVKRVKLVFEESTQSWASLRELAFYQEDIVFDSVTNMFTNGLMNELRPEFNNKDKINALIAAVSSHPLKTELTKILQYAEKILAGTDTNSTRVVTAEQRGRHYQETQLRLINGAAYASMTSIGRYVTKNEKITVYVDADPNGVMPQLLLGQVGKGIGDWRRFIALHPGKNEITANDNINPSALYLVNEATPADQAYAPRIRIEGGKEFPVYYHGITNPQEFVNELTEYTKNLALDDTYFTQKGAETKFFNIAEFVSENVIITTSALGAKEGISWAGQKNLTISDTMNDWETMYQFFQTFLGYSCSAEHENDTPFPNKFIARVFHGVPLGFADYGYTGYLGSNNPERNGGFFKLIAAPPTMPGNDNWCYTHEFGHIFNSKYIVHGEVTNNLFAQEFRRLYCNKGDRAAWDTILKRFQGEAVNLHYFESLALLSQLNIAYGYDAYTKASIALRDNVDLIKNIKGSDLQRLTVAYSLGLGVDLMDFFEGWGYVAVTNQMRDAVKSLPKETRKIEYLHGAAYDYAGNGINAATVVGVTTKTNQVDKTVQFNIDVENSYKEDVLGYELLQDGKLITYRKSNVFTITPEDFERADYQIVVYAKDLSKSKVVEVNTKKPVLFAPDQITLALNGNFVLSDYIHAKSYDNKPLVVEMTGEVRTDTRGQYDITVSTKSDGQLVEKDVTVNVVSSFEYLSDLTYSVISSNWNGIRKNIAPDGSTISVLIHGEEKVFQKGLGAHANSELQVNVAGKGYDSFETLIGIDNAVRNNADASVKFLIYADDVLAFESGIFYQGTNAQQVSIPLTGVHSLRLVTNMVNGNNYSDHAVWADAKFIKNNSEPVLMIPQNDAIRIGEEITELYGSYQALDTEDGDITDQVVTIGSVNNRKPGRYPITYRVSDSDGNVVTSTRYISVVYMEDYYYASEVQEKSAQIGWGSIQKNLAPSGRKISLTNTLGETVSFDKGIGAHAASTIIYDLSNSNAAYFSSYVGIDREMYNTVGSVAFAIWLDGKKVAETGVIHSKDSMQYLEVEIAGAKELKLIASDGGNGNGSDHAVWADAKFHYANENRIFADKTELQNLLLSIDQLNKNLYVQEGIIALEKIKVETQPIIDSLFATQEEINEIVNRLEIALHALELLLDYSELEQELNQLKALDLSIYTKASVVHIEDAITNGETMLQNATTQEELDTLRDVLRNVKSEAKVSEGKEKLQQMLTRAFGESCAKYEGLNGWNDYSYARSFYQNVALSKTVHEEAELNKMVILLEFYMEVLEYSNQ